MTKKFWVISILVILLAGLSVFEVLYAKETVNTLKEDLLNLQNSINASIAEENTEFDSLTTDAKDLLEYWDGRESVLCLIFNHNDMKDIAKEITQVISYLEQDDLKEAFVHTDLARQQTETLTHIIEFNLQNIF